MYGLILDIHGVLVDSNPARVQAWIEASRELGFHAEFSHVKALVGTSPNTLLIQSIGLGIDTPEGRAVFERYSQLFERRYLSRVIPQFGARELLRTLQALNLRLGVVSTDTSSGLLRLLQIVDCESLYQTSTEAERRLGVRSNRELLKNASQRIGSPANSTLFVTSSESQCVAAQQLNIKTIAINPTSWSSHGRSIAAQCYESSAEFAKNWDTSPIMMLGRTG
jgi:phosphoglycolate phosphatase-like HAD superfamily hydrolase